MTTPEGHIKKKVKEILKRYGVYYVMPFTAGYSTAGAGDFICCVDGKFLSIECKALGKTQSALQELDQERVQAAGGIKIIIRPGDEHRLELLLTRMLEKVLIP